MRVLVMHVAYRLPGGEDAAVDRDAAMLRAAGLDVATEVLRSADLDSLPLRERAGIAARFGDHGYGRTRVREAVERHRPDIVHFHNLFPLIGPGGMAEAGRLGCAVVRTLHNQRLSCLAATHFRSGRTCEECGSGSYASGIVHGCYRGSRLQSVLMASALRSEWAAMRESGIPDVAIVLADAHKAAVDVPGLRTCLRVVPNAVESREALGWSDRAGVTFVGRLSPEKGIAELAGAWREDVPLQVIGSGPLDSTVERAARGAGTVEMRGQVQPATARDAMDRSACVVLPSVCREGLPSVMLEALASGTPVVAFAHGAMAALAGIDPRLVVPTGDFVALARAAAAIARLPEGEWSALPARCLAAYRAEYTEAAHTTGLLGAYRTAVEARDRRAAGR